jgi:hypothetical protein
MLEIGVLHTEFLLSKLLSLYDSTTNKFVLNIFFKNGKRYKLIKFYDMFKFYKIIFKRSALNIWAKRVGFGVFSLNRPNF